MGFFDFLKKKEETVKFTNLDSWLDKQVEEKKLDKKIQSTNEEIIKLITLCKQGLQELEHAVLMNDQIPIREKQIMEGHRKIYIQKINAFLEKINLPKDFSQIGHYSAKFSESIATLASETGKNHYVLKQFFEVELTKITDNIKNIEIIIAKLQSDIDNAGVEEIKNAKLKLKEYTDDKERKSNLEKQAKSLKEEKEGHQRKKEKIESRLNDLKQSSEYQQFKTFIDTKKKSEENIEALENKLVTRFAEISRILRKYTHGTKKEKLAEKYLIDPVDAIIEDEQILIVNILVEMSQNLEKMELSENQIEKTKHHVFNNLSRNELSHIKEELDELKMMNRELASKINKSVIALNISESESLLKSITHKFTELEQEEEKILRELKDINVEYLKQKAKEKVKEINKSIIIEDEN